MHEPYLIFLFLRDNFIHFVSFFDRIRFFLQQLESPGQGRAQMKETQEIDTLRSLMDQNDELLARLRASQTKCAEFERKYREADHAKLESTSQVEALCDQILVFKEKDRIQKERLQSFEKEIESFQQKESLTELKFNEIQGKAKENLEKYEASTLKLSTKTGRVLRFRHWIKTQLYPAYRQQKKEMAELKSTLKDLHQHLYNSDNHVRTYKDQIDNLQSHLENQSEVFLKTQKEMNELKNRYLKLKDERTIHQNRVIAIERTLEELNEQHKIDLEAQQDKVSHFRQQTKALTLENESLSEQNSQLAEDLEKAHQQSNRLRDQNESIQELWTSNRKKTEQLSQREEALQKLNQELGVQLKDLRSIFKQSQHEVQQLKEKAQKQIQQVQSEVHSLTEKTKDNVSAQKIELLLAEIQSGYSQKPIQTKLPHHDFTEEDTSELISEAGEISPQV